MTHSSAPTEQQPPEPASLTQPSPSPTSVVPAESTPRACLVCGGTSLSRIDTYKHFWYECAVCGNIVRERKTTYPLERIPLLRRVLRGIPKVRALPAMLDRKPVGEEWYSYYLDAAKGHRPTAAGTKWEGQFDRAVEELRRLGIEVAGKRILDVSGGPGFFVQEAARICPRAVVTEYSRVAVDRMRSMLGVEAVAYDFANDDLRDVVSGEFDVVFIRYAINFSTDIPRVLSSLRGVLAPGGVVYVSFVLPSLGVCVRWQLDDYTYLVLYQEETMRRYFAEAGLSCVASYPDASYHFASGAHRRFRWLHRAAYLANRTKHVNTDPRHRNWVMVFR